MGVIHINTDEILSLIINKVLSIVNKKILIFFTGGAVNLRPIFKELERCRILNYKIVCSESSKRIIPEKYLKGIQGQIVEEKDDLTSLIKEADYILVPVMTRNTLAKCAGGIQDNLVTIGIAEGLMMAKNITVVDDSFSPLNPVNIELGYTNNAAYNNLILRNKEVLKNLGVNFITSNELHDFMNKAINFDFLTETGMVQVKDKFNDLNKHINSQDSLIKNQEKEHKETKILKGIITAEDLMNLCILGEEIVIDRHAVLTPLAKDYIYDKKINYKES